MLIALGLRNERKWLNLTVLILGVLLLLFQGMNNYRLAIVGILMIIIGSKKENIYVDSKGIVFNLKLLFFISIKTLCLFEEADKLAFEKIDDEFTLVKYLCGNKMKRIRVKNEDSNKIIKWAKIANPNFK